MGFNKSFGLLPTIINNTSRIWTKENNNFLIEMNHWLFLILFFFLTNQAITCYYMIWVSAFFNFFLFKKPIMCSTCHCLKVVSGVMSFSCHPLISIVIPIYTMALPTVCRHKDMTWCWRSPEMAVGSVLQGQNVVYKLMFYNGKSTKKEKEILPWSYSKCINKVGWCPSPIRI